jgi:hypothetical protein
MKKRILLLLIAAMTGMTVSAQQIDEKNTKWMEYLEEMADNEGVDENMLENLFSDLSYLSEHPFNLNEVTKKELQRLPFLSDMQIEAILFYVYRYAPLASIYELKNIVELDLKTIEYLLPFVYVGTYQDRQYRPTAREILRYGKHEVLARYDYCLQEKSGYKDDPEEEKAAHPSRYYLGERYYTSFKYGFRYKEKIQLGVVGEKDPGEAFLNEHHKGFDYYSAHLALRDIGLLETLIVGDYRASFGQGLILNTDFTMLNTSDVININKKSNGIKRHHSTGESNAFRGLAFALKLKQTTLSVFYSHRKSDATVEDSTIFSFKTDGYRRTPNDLLKKDRATQRLTGANVAWENDLITAGLTGIYYDFDGKRLDPEPKPYNIHYLRGKYNYNLGAHYTLRRKRFVFQGETAVGKNGATACLNSLQMNPTSHFNVVLLHRYFSMDYQADYAAIAGSSTVQNENGFYLGATFFPSVHWKISASADLVEHPWLKFGIDAPSKRINTLLSLDYSPSANVQMNLRYKHREREKNISLPARMTNAVLPAEQENLRYQINWQINTQFSTKSQLNLTAYQLPEQEASRGYMFSQSIAYVPKKIVSQGDLYIAYFHTDNWDTRISAYEKSILYAFSAPSFYGEGLRCCITLKWTWNANLSFYAKGAWTRYFDREVISSELEAINGKDKTDIYCLVKWNF